MSTDPTKVEYQRRQSTGTTTTNPQPSPSLGTPKTPYVVVGAVAGVLGFAANQWVF